MPKIVLKDVLTLESYTEKQFDDIQVDNATIVPIKPVLRLIHGGNQHSMDDNKSTAKLALAKS